MATVRQIEDIRSEIAKRGIKQKYLAEQIGITPVYLSMMLTGIRCIPSHIKVKIDNFLLSN